MDSQGRNYKSILQQVWIGVISSFGVISTGMSLGFSAVALPQLQNSSHLDYLDVNQASWFGLASVPAAVYLAEISEHSIRGMLVTFPSVAISLGILIVYVLGMFFNDNWRLVAENNDGEYFANCSTIEASPSTIKLPNSEEIRAHSINTNSMAEELKQRLYILLLPQAWKPIFILNSYFFFQQFSGIYVVVFYAVDIVQQAGVVIDAYTATVLLGLVQLIAGIAASFALTSSALPAVYTETLNTI
uniref:Uncharacterized protein n=1 Tax=Timema genevievae TaxID=629358 RepID=A0A7R9K8W1_TIMGE|nr:unnamed protein product [Timema genevievae]